MTTDEQSYLDGLDSDIEGLKNDIQQITEAISEATTNDLVLSDPNWQLSMSTPATGIMATLFAAQNQTVPFDLGQINDVWMTALGHFNDCAENTRQMYDDLLIGDAGGAMTLTLQCKPDIDLGNASLTQLKDLESSWRAQFGP